MVEKRLTLDHVLPKSLGGPNQDWNLVVSCWKCQRRKKNLTLGQAGMILLPVGAVGDPRTSAQAARDELGEHYYLRSGEPREQFSAWEASMMLGPHPVNGKPRKVWRCADCDWWHVRYVPEPVPTWRDERVTATLELELGSRAWAHLAAESHARTAQKRIGVIARRGTLPRRARGQRPVAGDPRVRRPEPEVPTESGMTAEDVAWAFEPGSREWRETGMESRSEVEAWIASGGGLPEAELWRDLFVDRVAPPSPQPGMVPLWLTCIGTDYGMYVEVSASRDGVEAVVRGLAMHSDHPERLRDRLAMTRWLCDTGDTLSFECVNVAADIAAPGSEVWMPLFQNDEDGLYAGAVRQREADAWADVRNYVSAHWEKQGGAHAAPADPREAARLFFGHPDITDDYEVVRTLIGP